MKRWLFGAMAGGLVVAAFACGEGSESSFPDGDGSTDSGLPPLDDGGVVSARGVILVHAAAFPAFRICFENYPEQRPIPDTEVMPSSNVVGVAMGSLVRLPPLEKPPGKVFVIDRRKASAMPGDPNDKPCGAWRDTAGHNANSDYFIAGSIDTPLGVDGVQLLAITGCAGSVLLNGLGVPSSACKDWTPNEGSLRAVTMPLASQLAPARGTLPTQFVHLGALVESQRLPGETLEVSFGPFDAASRVDPLSEIVASSPPLFEAGAPKALELDQLDESVYGTHGFRIALRDGDAGRVVDQTLAEVQEFSLPRSIPTAYFVAPANYALLLMGDPRYVQVFDDGGRNPDFDARRGVHLIAVPVAAEKSLSGIDSPPDASSTTDASGKTDASR
jgi:hypothetical protein